MKMTREEMKEYITDKLEDAGYMSKEQMIRYIVENLPGMTMEQLGMVYGSVFGITGIC